MQRPEPGSSSAKRGLPWFGPGRSVQVHSRSARFEEEQGRILQGGKGQRKTRVLFCLLGS